MHTCILLLLRHPFPLTTAVRHMGGGPRTFPGGLNKWQWKRLHEKKAKEKEKRLLHHEKQLYQARLRSHIRAQNSPNPPPTEARPDDNDHSPRSAEDHIKALADRFMKAGAEDLWNEKDGPVKKTEDEKIRAQLIGRNRQIRSPIDLRELGLMSGKDAVFKPRSYFTCARSANSMILSNAFEPKCDGSVNSMVLNDGFKPICGGSANSMISNDGFETKCNGSVDSMILNYGFKLGCVDNDNAKSNCGCRLKPRYDGSVNSIFLNNGLKPKYGSGINSMILNDEFKVCTNSMILNHCSKPENIYRGSLNYGTRPRHFSVNTKSRKKSRFDFSDDSSDEDLSEGEGEEEERKGTKKNKRQFASSAALGKYDRKKTRRVPLKFLDDEENLSNQVEAIRNEVRERSMVGKSVERNDEVSIFGQKRFDEYNVSPLTVKALTQAGYVQMTKVQEASLSVCLEGQDALVKAKTGTGKSAALLLPAIETVLKALGSNKKERVPPVYVLILCPTRELASQLAAEANVMLKYHEGIGVQTLVGGTRFKVDQKRLESDPCQIIVATPGRLLDHIESKSALSVRLMGLKILIVDEADHLLDLGFRKDMEKIVDCLPRQRQSLLFSATVPKEVRRISQLVLKREHAFIDTVGMNCVETHSQVKQFSLVAPHDLHFQMVHHLLNDHISQTPDYKVIVFCTTAMVTSLMFILLRELKMNVREMHSRKPQLYRTRISEEFRDSKRLILVTSDVSARGVNYPDVTLVIQVGIPADRENYIHRLGRTGREGKEGKGILLLAPWEEYFLNEMKDLPIENFPLPNLDPDAKIKMEHSMAKIDSSVRESAYHAWLGYYNSINEIGRDKTTLVELAHQFGQSIGLEKPPSMFRKTAVKMGLRDIPGIRIRK